MVYWYRNIHLVGITVLSLGFTLSCSSSSFKGSSGTKDGGNLDGGPSKNPAANDGGSGASDIAANGSGSGSGSSDSGANGNGITSDSGDHTCKPNTISNNYNIMFVFDNTGSQLTTDPTNVRRSGALSFLDQFNTYVGKFPAAQVYMGVLSFNTKSIHSTNGWMLLNTINSSVIKQEIVTATTNPNGLTSFSPVLKDAATFFAQVNALPGGQNSRNYLVFLTDGDPNLDTPAAINSAVADLVNNYGVAMIALATGPQVTKAGENLVQALALPTTPGKFPDHMGRYYRAPDAPTLEKTWKDLFGTLGGCK